VGLVLTALYFERIGWHAEIPASAGD